MNIFVTIEKAITFKKVTYYTVKIDEGDGYDELTEFEKFVNKFKTNKEVQNEYNDTLSFLRLMGDKWGAQKRYFSRNEQKAEALPPKRKELNKYERRIIAKQQHNLRLYCMRINEEVVFLFNGGVKTPGPITAQQCKNVKNYFKMANQFAQAIDEHIIAKDITIDGLELEFDETLELNIKQ